MRSLVSLVILMLLLIAGSTGRGPQINADDVTVLGGEPDACAYVSEAVQSSYPFESLFRSDLADIASDIPEIAEIYIKSYLDMRPIALWAFTRITYTAGLSDIEKVDLQYQVQVELVSKWYINLVEPNYIAWIPEQPPPPWPGFVIGDLNVRFIDAPVVRNINTSLNYATIQEAINANATLNGHTIYVSSGTYYENVVVNKSISVVGESRQGTRVNGNGSDTVFRVTANEVTIQGFSLESASYGVYLLGSNNSHVIDNFIDDVLIGGIILEDSCNNTVEANLLEGFPSLGIAVVVGSELNTIEGNEIRGCHDYGLNLMADDNLVVGNTIVNCSAAFYVACLNNTLYHNNAIGNYVPVIGGELNFWDNGCEGNYWDTYNGTDMDNDGVGDTFLPWEGVDGYPLVNPYWNSGDVDHDLDVDLFDAVKCAIAYGSTPSSPNWNPHSDVAEPYGVISIFDMVLIAGSYGKERSR